MPYFVERQEDVATIHFNEDAIIPQEHQCYSDIGEWLDQSTNNNEWWADHYPDVEWFCEERGWVAKRCPLCFGKPRNTTTSHTVHVVMLAVGCVGPDIFVTTDKDLARWKYLEWDKGLREDDLITWQQVNVTE